MKITKTVLGIDVSTKTCGISLFDIDGRLLELKYVAFKVKKEGEEDILFEKADQFKEYLQEIIKENPTTWGQISKVCIEEPLISSNNIYTVSTLLRFNGMISKTIYDLTNVKPQYISTYEARKHAFPQLMAKNKYGKVVLFGGYPKDIDKKSVIFDLVSEREPQIAWPLNKHSKPIKECWDMSDAYTVVLSTMRKEGAWL